MTDEQIAIDAADASEFVAFVGPGVPLPWRPWGQMVPDLQAWADHHQMPLSTMVRCALEKELHGFRLHRDAALLVAGTAPPKSRKK